MINVNILLRIHKIFIFKFDYTFFFKGFHMREFQFIQQWFLLFYYIMLKEISLYFKYDCEIQNLMYKLLINLFLPLNNFTESLCTVIYKLDIYKYLYFMSVSVWHLKYCMKVFVFLFHCQTRFRLSTVDYILHHYKSWY